MSSARKRTVKRIYALTCAHVAIPNLPAKLSGKSTKPHCLRSLCNVDNNLRSFRRI